MKTVEFLILQILIQDLIFSNLLLSYSLISYSLFSYSLIPPIPKIHRTHLTQDAGEGTAEGKLKRASIWKPYSDDKTIKPKNISLVFNSFSPSNPVYSFS